MTSALASSVTAQLQSCVLCAQPSCKASRNAGQSFLSRGPDTAKVMARKKKWSCQHFGQTTEASNRFQPRGKRPFNVCSRAVLQVEQIRGGNSDFMVWCYSTTTKKRQVCDAST